MAMDSASIAPLEKEGVKGADAGAQKLASAFRKKKKQAPPMKGGASAPMAYGGKC